MSFIFLRIFTTSAIRTVPLCTIFSSVCMGMSSFTSAVKVGEFGEVFPCTCLEWCWTPSWTPNKWYRTCGRILCSRTWSLTVLLGKSKFPDSNFHFTGSLSKRFPRFIYLQIDITRSWQYLIDPNLMESISKWIVVDGLTSILGSIWNGFPLAFESSSFELASTTFGPLLQEQNKLMVSAVALMIFIGLNVIVFGVCCEIFEPNGCILYNFTVVVHREFTGNTE